MKLIGNSLYLEFNEAVEAGFSSGYLWKARSLHRRCWDFRDDPDDRRKVLIGYDALAQKERYKEQVQNWLRKKVGCQHVPADNCTCGDPYAYMALQPIRDMIRRDDKAEAFFLAFRYDGPTGAGMDSLPAGHVEKYTRQAGLLNMLVEARKNKKQVKEQLHLRLDAFHLRVIDLIRLDGYDLPTTYPKLMSKLREYEKDSYASLISWRFGNRNARKVNDEVSESLLLELISHPNQHDDVYIEWTYNKWASENGYKCIDRSTVGVWRRKFEYLTMGKRVGNAAWYDKFGKEVKGFRPTQPLFLVESDDNHIDLLFTDPDDTSSHKHYHRFKAIVVTDSYNDYVLGYAFAEELTTAVVRAAYLNAMHHIQALTGGWYLPHEVKTDRWALSDLQPFYEGLGHYYPTPVGSKRRGYLEQFFGSALWKRCIKADANNYTGNNLTARSRGVNTEELALMKKEYPTIQEAPAVIDAFFNRLRMMPGPDGKSKQQAWLEAWCEMPEADKRPATDEQVLLKCGIRHMPKNGRRNTITNGGIEPQIGGRQYSYTIPPALYLPNVGKKVDIIYDPYDMSRVLLIGDHLRIMAHAAQLTPRAMADYAGGDRLALNALLDEKRADAALVAGRAADRREVLRRQRIDPDTLLQAGVLVKELRQQAELAAPVMDRENYDPFDQA